MALRDFKLLQKMKEQLDRIEAKVDAMSGPKAEAKPAPSKAKVKK